MYWRITSLTEVALETFMLRNPVEANEGRVPDCLKDGFKNCRHFHRERQQKGNEGRSGIKR
jgi:hypothetical protein